jgi:hypothetical protein
MLEPGRCTRLAMKPADHVGSPREMREQDFHRDVAAKLAIACAIHRRHPAFADVLGEIVATERVSGADRTELSRRLFDGRFWILV